MPQKLQLNTHQLTPGNDARGAGGREQADEDEDGGHPATWDHRNLRVDNALRSQWPLTQER